MKLSHPSAYPSELFDSLRKGFQHAYQPRTPYRLTGVVLAGLVPENRVQYTLFDNTVKIEKLARVYGSIDELSEKFGKHTVQHGTSLSTKLQIQHEGERGDIAKRKNALFKGENRRQRLGLPLWHIKV